MGAVRDMTHFNVETFVMLVIYIQGITELDLSTFVFGGVNITGFSIVDNETAENVKLLDDARGYELHPVGDSVCLLFLKSYKYKFQSLKIKALHLGSTSPDSYYFL
jgi:hypothetical protein